MTDGEVGWYCCEMNQQAGGQSQLNGLKASTAEGVAGLVKSALAGADGYTIGMQATQTAGDILGTAIGVANPLLGMAVSLTTTMLSGLIGGASRPDPMKELYETIMNQVA